MFDFGSQCCGYGGKALTLYRPRVKGEDVQWSGLGPGVGDGRARTLSVVCALPTSLVVGWGSLVDPLYSTTIG